MLHFACYFRLCWLESGWFLELELVTNCLLLGCIFSGVHFSNSSVWLIGLSFLSCVNRVWCTQVHWSIGSGLFTHVVMDARFVHPDLDWLRTLFWLGHGSLEEVSLYGTKVVHFCCERCALTVLLSYYKCSYFEPTNWLFRWLLGLLCWVILVVLTTYHSGFMKHIEAYLLGLN